MIEAGEIRVIAVADPIRCGFGYPVLVQLRCELGTASRVAHALADRSDVRFLALVTGSFDIVMELIVPSRRYLAGVLLDELPAIQGIKETTTDTVLRNFKMSYDWSRDLLGGAGAEPGHSNTVPDATPANVQALDEIDLRLYEVLQEDGRRSFSELATTLAGHQEVRYLSATIGHSDLICEIILRSQEDLYDFSTRTLGRLPGMQGVDVGLELQTVKRAYLRMTTPEDAPVSQRPTGSRTGAA
jgi:DNA-binding Lrp family transcriptional regulator